MGTELRNDEVATFEAKQKKKSLKENHLEKFVRKKVEREMVRVWQKWSPFCDAPPRQMQSFAE